MHRHRTPTVHGKRKKLDDVRSDINVTPLVDVCLVLLIIFMVVTDKLTRGKDVALPKTVNHLTKNDTGDDLIVSVSRGSGRAQLWWDREGLKDLADLKRHLDDEKQRKSQRPLFIKADADLPYSEVYPVLIAVHDSGAPMVQLGTQELKEKK
jgi:biopolymer transport protein ExbD